MAELIPAVNPEALSRASEAVRRDQGECGNAALSIVACLAADFAPDEIVAVCYRLRALTKIAGAAEDGWTLSFRGRDYSIPRDALFRAASKAPLFLESAQPVSSISFDAERLLDVTLLEAESSVAA